MATHIHNFLNSYLCSECSLTIEAGFLYDVPNDKSRAEKLKKLFHLPADGCDVSAGIVHLVKFSAGLYPACVYHGAMNCVSQNRTLWRCRCGAGCFWLRPN